MAGDLRVIERAAIENAARGAEPSLGWSGQVIHQYGRLKVLAIPEEVESAVARSLGTVSPQGLSEIEQLGLAALQLRESPQYARLRRIDRVRANPGIWLTAPP